MHPEFRLDDGVVHLNHAAVAPWPLRTHAAVLRFADENMRIGSRRYAQWLAVEQELRGRLQRLIGADSPDDIALLKNTSEGLSMVAWGLEWQAGQNVVCARQEFPSNRIVWESLATLGVRTRLVDLDAATDPEQALMDAIDGDTRLLAVSSVQYDNGLHLNLERLGAYCRPRGVLFCIDAIQSLGALPFDVHACQADFVAADGHKWMLGPEGVALFYVRPALRDGLRLRQFGWHMVEHAGDFDRMDWEPAPNARRFECGSPNLLGIHALNASLSLIEETDIDAIARAVLDNSAYLIECLKSNGWQILTPQDPSRHAGIVTFRRDGADHQAIYRRLVDAGVLCALRGGGIRFSPHFHTTRVAMDRALEVLE
ncbi:MAG: aminotransferase class V-fold PLP-dependent enzyme [Chromatiales bacterium]|jgi:selenocysteine lyase/cysteine desulfurase|nr:aminotransferase class V-fold PLP-dependent enzyme [Chromatiales bacterium]MDX9765740.1 aminotransferase class V-fold PLP-dependent enzyme [Ectothiorhodospiraceae bacterium]